MIFKNTLFTFVQVPQLNIQGATIAKYKLERILKKTGAQNIVLVDDEYILPKKSVIESFSQLSYVKNRQWVADRFDCDNYAGSMYGTACEVLPLVAFGIVHVRRTRENDRHALNFFIADDEQLYFFEPQTGTYFQDKTYIPEFFYV